MARTISGGADRTRHMPVSVPRSAVRERERSQPVGIAILGCGYWGVNYVRALSELPETQIVVVCDQENDRLDEIAYRFPRVHSTTTSVEEALELDGVDAVVVCTPAQTHHLVARQCLLAGKHVLVEKPLTTSVDDAQDLDALARSQELVLMVGHTFVYNAGIRKVKEYIQNKAIGRVYYLYSRRTNLGPIRHDVNALWDLAAHDISIFNYLLDATPEWASAVGARVLRNGREDVGFVSLGYPDGMLGHLHVSWADPNKVREVVVVGSDRRIVFNDLDPLERVRVYDKGVAPSRNGNGTSRFHQAGFVVRDGDITSPAIEISEPLKVQCAHFLDCIVNRTRPLTGGAEGAAVVRVMQAIDSSVAANGAPVGV
jgi:predicted dehydrogenase